MPVKVTLTEEPTVAIEGESESSSGGGCTRVTEMLFELPPPGAGFDTERLSVPAEARSEAGAIAVSWVALAKVVVSAVLPAMTTEDGTKPVPMTLKAVSAEPA